MPVSMTGFGRSEAKDGDLAVTVEARSVNNRFLAVRIKSPPRLSRFEGGIEERVREKVSRGSVEIAVRMRGRVSLGRPQVDVELAKAWVRAAHDLKVATELDGALGLDHLLGLPGVVTIEDDGRVDDREWALVRRAVDEALAALAKMRAAEGARLAKELRGLLARVGKHAQSIEKRAPEVPLEAQKRLTKRIERLLSNTVAPLDKGQLEREVALIADKADVTEELARLKSHVTAFERTLAQSGPVGRALDFVVQEFAREANTIGSKNQDVAIGRQVLQLKADVERLREQVQNLE